MLSDIKEANPDRAGCQTKHGKQSMKENINMKKEQLLLTEKKTMHNLWQNIKQLMKKVKKNYLRR